jgi:uncharacterized protein (DUF983 family)
VDVAPAAARPDVVLALPGLDGAVVTCPDCHEGELLCGLYPPPECVRCNGTGEVDDA